MSAKKVLVAEDSTVLQNLIKRILTQSIPHQVDAAKNGKEVMAMVEKESYDLILMDINMPKINGLECSKQIRAMDDAAKKDVPIIAITGNAMNLTEEEFQEVGINEYLPKPIDFDALVGKVRKWTE